MQPPPGRLVAVALVEDGDESDDSDDVFGFTSLMNFTGCSG